MSTETDLRRAFAVRDASSLTEAVDVVRAIDPTAGGRSVLEAAALLRRGMVGAGPLDELLADPQVSDVCVNGPGWVWVDRGEGMRRSHLRLDSDQELRALAVRLAAAGGQRLDDAMPYADVRLSHGVRLHAVLPPLSPTGVHLSLRVPPRTAMTLDDLLAHRSLPVDGAEILTDLVVRGIPFLVIGGTGTGKTTVLSALLSLVPHGQRLVLVEDLAELRPDHPHVVRLEARRPNAEAAGEVSLATLIRQALRMRPDRLVVGEARGPEMVDLLAAFNTGHIGGCATLHCDRPALLPARVEALAATSGQPAAAARTQLAAGVRAVVHLCRDGDGRRRIAGIAALRADPGPSGDVHLTVVPAWHFAIDPDSVRRDDGADLLASSGSGR
jgi:pilus assembly protein CpaF